jgi:hypothetical protein
MASHRPFHLDRFDMQLVRASFLVAQHEAQGVDICQPGSDLNFEHFFGNFGLLKS